MSESCSSIDAAWDCNQADLLARGVFAAVILPYITGQLALLVSSFV